MTYTNIPSLMIFNNTVFRLYIILLLSLTQDNDSKPSSRLCPRHVLFPQKLSNPNRHSYLNPKYNLQKRNIFTHISQPNTGGHNTYLVTSAQEKHTQNKTRNETIKRLAHIFFQKHHAYTVVIINCITRALL